MNTNSNQTDEWERFMAYMRTVCDKWSSAEIHPEIHDELINCGNPLKKLLIAINTCSVKAGLASVKELLEESERQLQQLVYSSFFLGLEHKENLIDNVEPPQFEHSYMHLSCRPMVAFVASQVREMKESNNINQSKHDKWLESSVRLILNTAKQCYEKGLITPVSVVPREIQEIYEHVSRIKPHLLKYEKLMESLRALMNQRPTLFGRNKWESEAIFLLNELYTVAKRLPNQSKRGEIEDVWYSLHQICKETELMLVNFKTGIEGKDPNGITKANINKDKITYYFSSFEKALGELEHIS